MSRKPWLFGMSVILVTVMGCSSGSPAANNDSKGSENPKEGGSDGKEITYTIGRSMNPNGESIVKLEKETGETLENNRWTQLFKDELNVSIKYTLTAADTGAYNQSLKLAMASNDLPDIFQVTQTSDLSQLMAAGAIEEMGPLYEEHASDLLKSIIEAETRQVFDPATHNGKIYAIPMKMPSTNGYNHLWIREDWLTKLELERPKTIDDMYTIAKAFVERDPDGNGEKDTLGLGIDKAFRNNASGLFWAFGAYPHPGYWMEKEGKAVRGTVQPEIKKPLALLAKMYAEGLIDREFGSKDQNKAMESVVAGKTGMFYGPHWMAYSAVKTLTNVPDAKWITVPLPTESGNPIKIPLTNSVDGYLVVKKGAPNPENLIKIMNIYVEKLFGENAEFNKYFSEGGVDGIWLMSPVFTLDPMIDLIAHQDIKKAIAEGTTDNLQGSGKGFYKSMQEGDWSIEKMFGPKDTPFAFVDMTYPDNIVWNVYTGAPTATEVTRGSSMDELIETTMISIIMGKVDANSGVDKMIAEWKQLGGDQVTKEVNEALGK